MPARKEQPPSGLNGLKKYLVGVGVSVTVAILLQTMGLVWWAAAINERVKFLEKNYDRLSSQVYQLATTRGRGC